ncbi:MAG: hypothetical protein KatS3mg002_0577 [Candidatus Woesearchaeota archaeon]|nr:MAG: hypothetical protein KatS3mg002_0577 [Candidatus Woesearchaeota archaeon]
MRKGQSSSSAAAFIAILTVVIILYILFLPPDIREELLSDGRSAGGGTGTNINTEQSSILLRENIGRVSYLKDKEKYYDIPTVRIYSTTSGQVIKAVPLIYIKNSLFDKEQSTYTTTFEYDHRTTNNLIISFTVKDHYGPLIISLNGREIFKGYVEGNKFLQIANSDLYANNELKFSVPNPGVVFWKSNKYSIENIQMTADVTDYSGSSSLQRFTISESEKNNLESATLYFRPVCTQSQVGPLEIELNRRIIYNSIADCGTRSFASLNIENINAGSNELKFSAEKGSYLLDNLQVKLVLKKESYKVYYFDMSEKLFYKNPETARCGDYDNTCPPGCSELTDADCCFRRNGNWCAVPTRNPNDRCVYYVDPGDCDLCPTGYYDKYYNTPDTCENECGNNNDGVCPSSCPSPSKYYDADCCWEENQDYFFCKEVPITGLMDRCRASVSYSQCELCPSGYRDEDGSRPSSCNEISSTYKEFDESLDSNYDVRLTVRFIDDENRKKIDININGRKIAIDTRDIEFKKNIDEYVVPGSNSIELIPREDVNIAELKIELIKVR